MPQIYSKDSFSRFDDDLCQLLLSFMSFEDKFRFECISRQFKRCVYEKQFHLTIDNKMALKLISFTTPSHLDQICIDLDVFNRILKKCSNIESIQYSKVYSNQNLMFDSIIKYCNHLLAIDLDLKNLDDEVIDGFFRRFGPNLRKIQFKPLYHNFDKNNLKLCPNIRDLNVLNFKDLSIAYDFNEILFKKLKKIKFRFNNEDSKRVEVLVDCNKRLESVYVFLNNDNEKEVKVLMNSLSKLSHLKGLELIVPLDTIYNKGFALLLTQIAVKCQKLKSFRFDLRVKTLDQIRDILDLIQCFSNLNRLDLRICAKDFKRLTDFQSFSCESLKLCKNITHLTLNIGLISDLFFKDIAINLPKLQSLDIFQVSTECYESALNHLKQLSSLQTLRLEYFHNFFGLTPIIMNESMVYEFMNTCPKIQTFYTFGKSYTKQSMN